jgi:hypothetical protein
MNAEKCLDYLITPSNPIEDKAEYLSEYIQWHETALIIISATRRNRPWLAVQQMM